MVKKIVIREDIYKRLLTMKLENESFSDFFKRLLAVRSSQELLIRLRGSAEFKNKKKMLSELYVSRGQKRR